MKAERNPHSQASGTVSVLALCPTSLGTEGSLQVKQTAKPADGAGVQCESLYPAGKKSLSPLCL